MIIDQLLSTLPPEVRDLPMIQGLAAITTSVLEQLNTTRQELQTTRQELQVTRQELQATKEQLGKAQEKIQDLEDELHRLRKLPKRPKFRSNNMEPRNRAKNKQKDSDDRPPLAYATLIHKEALEVKVVAENLPEGCRFKGYQAFTVQDIDFVVKEITYKLEVWQTPDGQVIRAKLPTELKGTHFGPSLKAFTTSLYGHGVTQPAIYELLVGLGFEISSGKINDILLDEAEQYAAAAEAILTAGLEEAPFIRVDDTGARHKHRTGYCTHIGGQFFAYYKTTFSKSRENFLKILLQGKQCYQINEAMIWHLFQCGVRDDILNLLEEHEGKTYHTPKGLNRLLNRLEIDGKKIRKQCHEAGLVGFISNSILRPGQVLLSDRAGQFALFTHAACWIHMERPLRKLVCSSIEVEKELEEVRNAIWVIYNALKQAKPEDKAHIHGLYDQLLAMKTMSVEINAVINNFAVYRDELLRVLDHPGLPLHNNDSERDIRLVAKRRNISGSTKSENGIKFRDGLLSLKQTCFRLGYNFWEYLQLWFRGQPPDLAELVRQRYRLKQA